MFCFSICACLTCLRVCLKKRFLDKEGTSQTLLFLLEIDEFKKIPQYGFQLSSARKIFNKFVHMNGIMPVPVTAATRSDIAGAIKAMDISQSLFAKAATEVFEYIEHKQFPRCVAAIDCCSNSS